MNLEYFKNMPTAPRMNGLGFIWIMESKKVRWNFYHPELTPVVVNQFHNHRDSFVSKIMKGTFCNQRAVIVHPGDMVLRSITCVGKGSKSQGGEGIKEIQKNIGLDKRTVETYYERESYGIRASEFHIAYALTPAITKMTMQENDDEVEGLGVYNKEDEMLCPIADFHADEELCWQIIQTILDS